MGTSLDALNAPPSLTARRQAASNLPNFELPPPNNLQFTNAGQRFPPLSTINAIHHLPASGSMGTLLTPPSNSASDSISPVSSGLNSTGTPGNQGILPYTPSF